MQYWKYWIRKSKYKWTFIEIWQETDARVHNKLMQIWMEYGSITISIHSTVEIIYHFFKYNNLTFNYCAGWTHSRMVEVIVHRVDSSAGADGTPRNKAVLVFQDGCNNPLYSVSIKNVTTVRRCFYNRFVPITGLYVGVCKDSRQLYYV